MLNSQISTDVGSLAQAVASGTYQATTVRMTGDAALKPRDIQAICRFMNLPIPTPSVTFDDVLSMSGLDRETLYLKLERATDIDVMIATAALRSGVMKCADDKQLKPSPHRKTVKTPSEPKAERSPRSTTSISDDILLTAIIEEVGECPSKPGSERANRFAAYRVGITIADALKGGLRVKDVRRHIADGNITVRQP